MTQITYVWHDCFLVVTDTVALIFDYWLDEQGQPSQRPDALAGLPADLPLYIFVSHGHKDHFNPAIFSWASERGNVHYVVSNDVWKRIRHVVSKESVYNGPKVDATLITPLRRGESAQIGPVTVTALPSTDIGNSYLVSVKGAEKDTLVFHAGDLNAWLWLDESTEEEVAKARGDYRACLRDVAEAVGGRTVDIAFFPIDSRIGRGYTEGAREFLEKIRPARFLPMHFALGDAAERALRRRDAARVDLYAPASPTTEYALLTRGGDTLRW